MTHPDTLLLWPKEQLVLEDQSDHCIYTLSHEICKRSTMFLKLLHHYCQWNEQLEPAAREVDDAK